jgi:hypothetical protein
MTRLTSKRLAAADTTEKRMCPEVEQEEEGSASSV